jgi:hypothetical protein
MKVVPIENSIGLDRTATWTEIRYAMSFTSPGGFEFVSDCDDSSETDSDFNGRACKLSEENMWLAIARAIPASKSN